MHYMPSPVRIGNCRNLFIYIFFSPGQQDPTQESREVQEGILEGLSRGADVSVRVLEQLLGAGEVRGCFLI